MPTVLDEQKVYAMINDYFNTGTISNTNLPLKISEPKLNFQEEFERIKKERALVQVFKDPVAQEQKSRELNNNDPANQPPSNPAQA